MQDKKYSMSFTTGGLLFNESVELATLYLQLKDWQAVRSRVMAENLLQSRTRSAANKIYAVVVSRLKLLSDAELELLEEGSRSDQILLLWLGICKRFDFIRDFAVEVLHEKFLAMEAVIDAGDYRVFFNGKAQWHEELDRLAPVTRERLQQMIFKMMKDAELISKHHKIQPVIMSPGLINTLAAHSPDFLNIFPVSPANIREWLA
jgi:BrxA